MLDLGAAPGSWSLYAAERVGVRGSVVAVDLQEIVGLALPNVTVVRGNVFSLAEGAEGADDTPRTVVLGGAPYAIVLSDMAPSTSGSKSNDQMKSFELFMSALGVARHQGAPGASFVGKIFMSGDFPQAKRAVTEAFTTCRVIKPEGTRSNSIEIYIVGMGLRSGE